jgi:subtilisin-like proprotein convertase family protein
MRLTAVPLFALLACAVPEPESTVGIDAAPPPTSPMELTAPYLIRGVPIAVFVQHALPGSTVHLAASARPTGPPWCPAPIAPTCLDIPQPGLLLGSAVANANGNAQLTLTVPPTVTVPRVQLQAAVRRQGITYTSTVAVVEVLDPAGDADADGISNDVEHANGLDPLRSDSDGDSLLDGYEVNVSGTDPLAPDTDGGGADDGDELSRGTDPLFAQDDVCQTGPCEPDCEGIWGGPATVDLCGVCDADPQTDCCTGPFDLLDADDDGTPACMDCDDNDPLRTPGALESCDGLDNDCDGQLGEGEQDADGDNVIACFDCDDLRAEVFPGAPEICDGLDNDCVPGTVAPATTVLRHVRLDGPGDIAFDEQNTRRPQIAPPPGIVRDVTVRVSVRHSRSMGDVDVWLFAPNGAGSLLTNNRGLPGESFARTTFDDDAALPITAGSGDYVGYFRPERPLSVFRGLSSAGAWSLDVSDNNPDGLGGTLISWTVDFVIEMPAPEVDADGDGVPACANDCDDTRPDIGAGLPELCDGLDNDCNGALPASERDLDGDGFGVCQGDCDDASTAEHPGAPERCDGLDNDCNGILDAPGGEQDLDGDGARTCDEDCDEADPLTYHGAPEQCDGLDNDCDGEVPSDELDFDNDGWTACQNDCDETRSDIRPDANEICDGIDTDCVNGPSAPGEVDNDGDGWHVCSNDCNDNNRSVRPGLPEICDGLDNDCDGVVPYNEWDTDGDGWFACNGDCNIGDGRVHPGVTTFSRLAIDASFNYDYNCDGVQEPRWTQTGTPCNGAFWICNFQEGWRYGVPSCGTSGLWIVDCPPALFCELGAEVFRYQECR